MPVVQPEFSRWINPILSALAELDGSARRREVAEHIARSENISDDVLDRLNASGGERFSNQLDWARYYLVEAGYIDRSKHGVWKLTEKGVVAGELDSAKITELVRGVRERDAAKRTSESSPETSYDFNLSVDKSISSPLEEVRSPPDEEDFDYRTKLINILRSITPEGFERLCQLMLREAGFEQVMVTGKSGDGGIDGHGILSVNPFVSFRVLFQCKRYTGSVSPSQVRDFRGAMQGRADKGLILTTGSFTAEARREASRDGAPPVELVDSEKLVDLFAKLELGLKPTKTYFVDESFFNEYR